MGDAFTSAGDADGAPAFGGACQGLGPCDVYVRFVVAAPALAGQSFDVCWAPWDGLTTDDPDSAYRGPLLAAWGATSTLRYPATSFYIAVQPTDAYRRYRLVRPGSDCSQASIITAGPSHTPVALALDKAKPLRGYHTAVISGDRTYSATGQFRLDVFDDPTAAPAVPTLELVDAFDGASGVTLDVTLDKSDGTLLALDGASGFGYPSMTRVSQHLDAPPDASVPIDIALSTLRLTLSTGEHVAFDVSSAHLRDEYYWVSVIGQSASDLSISWCENSLGLVSSTTTLASCSTLARK